jgi:hypothetical protein
MLNYIILSLTCILAIEIIKKFNLIESINSIIDITSKIKTVIFSKNIGDNWKEVILPTYAFKIMQYSSKIIATLLLIIGFILVINAIFTEFLNFLLSLTGIIASIIISTAYILVRTHLLNE